MAALTPDRGGIGRSRTIADLTLTRWLRGKRATVSLVLFSLVVTGPVLLAVLHRGFPVTVASLTARNVWVVNQPQQVVGRLNMQISQLNAAAVVPADQTDVYQDGDSVFVYTSASAAASVKRIDPAFVQSTQQFDVPPGAMVAYGGNVIAVLDVRDGRLWMINSSGDLAFDYISAEPVGTFGGGAKVAVGPTGVVFVASPGEGALFSVADWVSKPKKLTDLDVSNFDITAVGEHAAILDLDANRVVTDSGKSIPLPETAIRLQQAGPARGSVMVASGDGLMKVGLSGGVDVIDAQVSVPIEDRAFVSAPVVVGDCVAGAWSGAATFLSKCGDAEVQVRTIPEQMANHANLEFRVNRNLYTLSDGATGLAMLPDDNLTIVDNWPDVIPPPQQANATSGETTRESFADAVAKRNEDNTPPIANDDALGARPGVVTALPVLQNDSDADGDVLAIVGVTDIPASQGLIEVIDGGRSLQFVPAATAAGTVSFRYTVDDGRGGRADAAVHVAVSVPGQNAAPFAFETSTAAIEAGQTVTYSVLTDWIDPDGDPMLLTAAAASGGDVVRFTPDGSITYTHRSSELGPHAVDFTVSDGTAQTAGQMIVDVAPAGTLAPAAIPDSAVAVVGQNVTVEPLKNDVSPSGAVLSLASAVAEGAPIPFSVDLDHNTITATAFQAGTYYLKYTLSDGRQSSGGMFRLDVVAPPETPAPPIAVSDTAYVRANQPTRVGVLANDVSLSGAVLGVQSVAVPDGAPYTVEILGESVLRVSSAEPLSGPQPAFSYTISDGQGTATATVNVVAVPELAQHQAPIAAPDAIKIRAGDFATVAVLANDYHPDGARMYVDDALVQTSLGADGLAFVGENKVRVQAPSTAGEFAIVYAVRDDFGQSSTAKVSISVVAPDPTNNTAPVPTDLTARVFAGGTITVSVPLDGIDPDGDSAELDSVSAPALGTIVAMSSTAFTYRAFSDPGTVGTDSFTYQVRDGGGLVGTATVHIGVIPRAATPAPPDAVNDTVTMLPGHTASVAVLANDSDPNGYVVTLAPTLPVPPPAGVEAAVQGDLVVVKSGLAEGSYVLTYQASNELALTSTATLTVVVSADAPAQPPVAVDQVVPWKDAVAKEAVDVNVLTGALNPSGSVDDLQVSVEGINAGSAQVLAGGQVRVTLTDARQAIAYRLTNPADGLSAVAFVVVPKYAAALPPALREDLQPQVISMNQTKEWKLPDIAYAPSGRDLLAIHPEIASVTDATGVDIEGDSLVVDGTTLRYTPEPDWRGRAKINFQVTDGASADDPTGVVAGLTLTFTVGDPTYADVPPTFTAADVNVPIGESKATVFDLRAASSHPNPAILAKLGYADLAGGTADVNASISGSSLSLTAPQGAQIGATAVLSFSVTYGDLKPVPAQVTVHVVASLRPLPQAVDDRVVDASPNTTYAVSVLGNDSNPWSAEGYPLVVTAATFEGDSLGASTPSVTASGVTVTTGAAKSGTISVLYTIQDHLKLPQRSSQARLTIVVISAPEPVADFTLTRGGSGEIVVNFLPTSNTNGADVTEYRVRMTGSPATAERTDCVSGVACSFTGRTNGEVQTVTVAATNRAGTTWSTGKTAIPYGTPGDPTNVRINTSSANAPANLTAAWTAPSNTGGGTLTYTWQFVAGSAASGSTTGTQGTTLNSQPAGDYQVRVQACNPGGLCSGWVTSPVRTVANAPAMAWVTRSGNTLTYHWQNMPSGQWPEVDRFRCWRYTMTTHPGGWATDGCGEQTGFSGFPSGSGSVSFTYPGASDSFSIEPWKFGPWLTVGESWVG